VCCVYSHSDKTVVNRYLLSVLVRLFLEKLEQSILKFVTDFSHLTVSDEKVQISCVNVTSLLFHGRLKIFLCCRCYLA